MAYTVFGIPVAGVTVAGAFYFAMDSTASKKSHSAHRNTQNKHTHQIPMEVRPRWKVNSDLSHLQGLNLIGKFERSLGYIRHQNSVLSGLLPQTMHLQGGPRGFTLLICLGLKKKSHPVDSS